MGTITVAGQLEVFGYSLLLGIGFCVLYDVLRALHTKYVKSFLAVFATDILYWLLLIPITHWFLLIYCNGRIRAYVFVGIAIGFVIFRLTLSKLLLKLLLVILYLLQRLLHFAAMPLFVFLSLVDKLFVKLGNMLKNKPKKYPKKEKST